MSLWKGKHAQNPNFWLKIYVFISFLNWKLRFHFQVVMCFVGRVKIPQSKIKCLFFNLPFCFVKMSYFCFYLENKKKKVNLVALHEA